MEMEMSLSGVAETAFIPLWGRASAKQMNRSVGLDSDDSNIVDSATYDFDQIAGKAGSLSETFLSLMLATRAREMDWQVRQFLQTHPSGTVVNVGAGLDDLFSRADNGRAAWFDVDAPEVIAMRRKLIAATKGPRVHEIEGSILEDDVLDQLPHGEDGILFVFSGVLLYFKETQVKVLFDKLSKRFASHMGGAQMVFDTFSNTGGKWAEVMVARRSKIENAPVLWTPGHIKNVTALSNRVRAVESYPLLKNTLNCPAWSKSLCLVGHIADKTGFYRMNRIAFY